MISCTFEDGVKTNLRHVVVDCLIVEKNKILLIKRAPSSYKFPDKIALPGGYVDLNETVEEAALREVYEETGYKVKIDKFIKFIDDPKREDRQNITFVYLMSPLEKVKKPDHEVTEVIWTKFDSLPPKEEFAFDHYKIIQDFLKTKNY